MLLIYWSDKMTNTKSKTLLNKITVKRKLAVKILLKSVTYAFALFGLLFILLLFVIVGMLSAPVGAVAVPQNAILQIDLDEPFNEVRRDSLLTDVGSGIRPSFADLIFSIDAAGQDDRVKAIVAKISNSELGLAQMQELYGVIRRFRSHGKKAYLYSAGFGDFGGGTSEYYLANAFDEITMLPNSDFGVTGISIEVPFLRNVLDKFGVYPEFYARHEFKNAMASFIDKKSSKSFYDELSFLAEFFTEEMFRVIIPERYGVLSKKDYRSIINRAPMSSEEALNLGLIDKIGYEFDWREEIKKSYQGEFLDVADYASNWMYNRNANKIALLVLEGAINQGLSVDNPLSGEALVGSDTVLAQIDEIAKDKDIKAVIVRVNSPGGSYVASNEIWHALKRLKEKKQIPLVVSMSNYAASGGYFVSLAADNIFANTMTITGSIGVLGGKIVLEDMWKKLGVNWAFVETGETSGLMSINRSFNVRQKELFNKSLDRVYDDFVHKVAEARNIDITRMDKLARGRVWTGLGARENGLVSENGGLLRALEEVRSAAYIKPEDAISIVFYPKQKTLQEKISELTGGLQVATARRIKAELGLDISLIGMLKRLQYDMALPPFVIK